MLNIFFEKYVKKLKITLEIYFIRCYTNFVDRCYFKIKLGGDMQIEVQLSSLDSRILNCHYNYELSSALLHIMSKQIPELCRQLHDTTHKSRLKLYLFSPFNSSPHPTIAKCENGESGFKFGERVWMRFATIWPEVFYPMCEALSQAGEISVRGKRFKINKIEIVSNPEFTEEMIYRPFSQSSFIVCRHSRPNGATVCQFPDNSVAGIPKCEDIIAENLRHKLFRLGEVRPDIQENLLSISNLTVNDIKELPIKVEFLPLSAEKSYRTCMIRVKDSCVRGFRAPVKITAVEAIHRIAWNCGLGNLNSQGFGLVEDGRL